MHLVETLEITLCYPFFGSGKNCFCSRQRGKFVDNILMQNCDSQETEFFVSKRLQ